MKKTALIVMLILLMSLPKYVTCSIGQIDVNRIESSKLIQGDIEITGNYNYTIIDEVLNVNGSIYVRDNATIYLKNATLNIIQKRDWEHNILLNYSGNNSPHLCALNSTISSTHIMGIYFDGNYYDEKGSVGYFDKCFINAWISLHSAKLEFLNSYAYVIEEVAYLTGGIGPDISTVTIASSVVQWAAISNATISNSKIGVLDLWGSLEVSPSMIVIDSEINSTWFWIGAHTETHNPGVLLQNIHIGYYEWWNLFSNCSILNDAKAVNLTLIQSSVKKWSFRFQASIRVEIQRSHISELQPPIFNLLYERGFLITNESQIDNLWFVVGIQSSNISICGLRPGFYSSWDSLNTSMIQNNSLESSNITLMNTKVCNWGLSIGSSTISVMNSELCDLRLYSNNIKVFCCTIKHSLLICHYPECESIVFFHNNILGDVDISFLFSVQLRNWDDGYPSGGNYWSDYNGTDLYCGPYQNETGSDGIGDTPYVIDANNTDRYPLMFPWKTVTVVGDVNHDGEVDILDIILISSIYGCKEGEPNWNSEADVAPPYGIIDILDLVTCAAHYGEKSS